ncbi:uncharacterized protein LOC126558180 [Anopheles maculipalpis]|uniref:uncharacterized protein LOC126558180 n=1 Tax=Anopheles maculipalpis TaxID=1496333 RepID=UPI002159AE01|nr:uncharacterized protein LOC126558180 [Anopheles maculipalpis]
MELHFMLSRLIVFGCFVHLSTSIPFSFPDGSRSASSSSTSSAQRRQEAFEGRSIRGNDGSSSKNQFPDIYSRYQVHENDPDPPGVRPTAGPFLDRPGSITPPPPRYTTRSDRPNAAYNRLPPTKNDEPIQAEPAIDYDDGEDVGEEEEQPDKPVPGPVSAPIYKPPAGSYGGGGGSNTVNNLFYDFNDKFGGLAGGLTSLFGENRHKFKLKRRKPGQPCIPYSLFHKLKYGRDLQGNPVDPKTLLPHLNLVLADVNYYAPNNNYGGGGSSGVDYQSDTGTGGAVFNNHFYDAVGGYPCQGISFGGGGFPHKPFKPHRPHGGPLGFFGQGGLFDWVSSADQVQGDEGVGGTEGTSGNRPTVVFNLNDAIDTVATNWKPGEGFQMMMGVIANFITQVAGTAAAPVADVATDVRKINREFFSLFG